MPPSGAGAVTRSLVELGYSERANNALMLLLLLLLLLLAAFGVCAQQSPAC